MRPYTLIAIVMLFWIIAGCTSKGESQLSKALTLALKEKKISQKKMEVILVEYHKIRDDDKKIARQYAEEVLNAIEMGGDSTHIDAARRLILKNKPKEKV